jgi:M6 family metalloprotease-like protein
MKLNDENILLCRANRMIRKTYLMIVMFMLIGGLSEPIVAQELEDFGYNGMRVNGKEARGSRPLLVITASYDGASALAHDNAYYDPLIFNLFGQSVSSYTLEVSNGRFFWSRAGQGIIGPMRLSAAKAALGINERIQLITGAAVGFGIDFKQFDSNNDDSITNDELGVLIIDNGSFDAATTPPIPCFKPVGTTVSLCMKISIAGHRSSMMTLAHELSHQLGTLDLYGACECLNSDITLMGPTIYGGSSPDDQRAYHLDPWHKMRLGWAEPMIRSIRTPGFEYLFAPQLLRGEAAVILYDPARGTNEYFIIEYRTRSTSKGGGYDRNVASEGLAIWHVQTDGNRNPIVIPGVGDAVLQEGAPGLAPGSRSLWRSGSFTPLLRWADGSSLPARVFASPFITGSDAMSISWGYTFSQVARASGSLIQSTFGTKGNFELVVPHPESGLAHYYRDNDIAGVPWVGPSRFGESLGKVDAVSLIQSSFGTGAGNLEVIARAGNNLVFLWRDDAPIKWHGPYTLATGVRGNPALIQGRFGNVGNFELVVPMASGGIGFFFRNNDDPNLPWEGPFVFGQSLGQVEAVALLQSNYRSPGGGGHLEVIARVGSELVFFWREDQEPFTWNGPYPLIKGVTGIPSIIQGCFGATGNFEMVVPLASGGLAHFFRNNDDPNIPWVGPFPFGQGIGTVDSVSLIQSNYSSGGGAGHLEVVAQTHDDLHFFWREDKPPFTWSGPYPINPPKSYTPYITGAVVSGKKLFVYGQNFDSGAVIILNGKRQPTANSAQDPTTTLIANKSGKKVVRGQSVTIQVSNSDGSLSQEFSYIRP